MNNGVLYGFTVFAFSALIIYLSNTDYTRLLTTAPPVIPLKCGVKKYSEEEAKAMEEQLKKLYTRIYGERGIENMEYDIRMLMKTGLTRAEALKKRLDEMRGLGLDSS